MKTYNFELDDEFVPIFLLRRLGMGMYEVLEVTLEPARPTFETRLEESVSGTAKGRPDVSSPSHQYLTLAVISVARQITGFVFGSLVRSMLPQAVSLTLVPMTKRFPPVESEKSIQRQWELVSNRTESTDQSDP